MFKTNKDPSTCTCMCHGKGVVMMHMVACCHTCQDCGENIKSFSKHSKYCKTPASFVLKLNAEESVDVKTFSEACHLGSEMDEGFDVWFRDELWLSCVKSVKSEDLDYEVIFHNN